MTRLVVRLVLSNLVVPIAGLIYFVAFIGFINMLRDGFTFLWSGIVTAVFVASAWLSIWRGYVRWTSWRKWGTLLVALPSVGGAALLGMIGSAQVRGPDAEFTTFIASTLGILFWLGATVLLWKETASERRERLRQSSGETLLCPKCGYNLTGLHEATCPECGSRFTLNQLFAAQQSETIGDTTA